MTSGGEPSPVELHHRLQDLVAAGDVAGFLGLVARYRAGVEARLREPDAEHFAREHDSPLSMRDVEGCTLQMTAIERRQAHMIGLLDEASATRFVPDNRFLQRPVYGGDRGRTLFHVAAVRGDRACLDALAALRDARPNAPDGEGATPLHYAATAGRVDLFEWFVAHGVSLEAADAQGCTALYRAAANPEAIAALLRLGAQPDGAASKPPLQVALQVGRKYGETSAECTRLLLDAGADVREVDCRAAVESPATLRRLLERGARATPSALESAAAVGSTHAVSALLERGTFQEHDLVEAIRSGLLCSPWSASIEGVLRLLLAHGADEGPKSSRLTRCLLSAAARDGIEALTFALGMGVHVDATVAVDHPLGEGGGTALHVAAARLRAPCVALLLERGADPLARDQRGRRPFQLAHDAKKGPQRQEVMALLAAAESARAAPRPSGPAVGDVVTHAKFGEGTVEQVLGEGDATRLVIRFPDGLKTLLPRFVQSKR